MELKNIKIETYGNYSSNNYGVNAQSIEIGKLKLYFSYKTIIAFRDNGELTIIKNSWGQTTGKHLNAINSDKSLRIDRSTFDQKLNATLIKYGLI
jgi:hypothetical protein